MESDKDILSDSGEAKKLTASSKKKRYDQKVLDKWFLEETYTHFFKISESSVRCNRYKKDICVKKGGLTSLRNLTSSKKCKVVGI